jgi:UDP-N-acetylmuramate dehydrogenase
VLGGGSNVVVADEGIDALVVHLELRGIEIDDAGAHARVIAGAGEPWDPLVELAVARGLAGLECLSGIPGSVGATPIQNVGAYGQEVAETIVAVRVFDREHRQVRRLVPDECAFAYRDSLFKRVPDRHVVLAVELALVPGGAPTLRYAELVRALADRSAPTLAETRAAVLALRRTKSMVIDATDDNRRSVGSFFTNPIVDLADAERIVAHALADGLVTRAEDVPRYPTADGRCKLAAGWLIERAGFAKGERHGRVGISSRHALALVHHGGGTTRELLVLAHRIADAVAAKFAVTLVPEPVLLGTRW